MPSLNHIKEVIMKKKIFPDIPKIAIPFNSLLKFNHFIALEESHYLQAIVKDCVHYHLFNDRVEIVPPSEEVPFSCIYREITVLRVTTLPPSGRGIDTLPQKDYLFVKNLPNGGTWFLIPRSLVDIRFSQADIYFNAISSALDDF
jgi:hypothetical protein